MTASPRILDDPAAMNAVTRENDQHRNWRQWWLAAAQPHVDASLLALYTELDHAVAQRRLRCRLSGRCCRFDDYGHRLYVTGLEIAWFLRHLQDNAPSTANDPSTANVSPLGRAAVASQHSACPWQVNNLCTAHTARPLGCRIFFCQKGSEHWQQQLYERLLTRLRAMHDDWALPYHYLEWRAGLTQAAQALASPPDQAVKRGDSNSPINSPG